MNFTREVIEKIVEQPIQYYVRIDFSGFKKIIDTLGGVEINVEIPADYTLLQNFPNPFNPMTTISYSLPEESNVTIKIFNTLGNEVGTIVNERQNTGSYNVSYNAMSLSSGVYFYRIEAYSLKDSRVFIETKKMSVIK